MRYFLQLLKLDSLLYGVFKISVLIIQQPCLQAHQKGRMQQLWWLTCQRQLLTHQMETSCKNSEKKVANWPSFSLTT